MTITDLTLTRPGRRTTSNQQWRDDGLCRDQAPMWDSDTRPDDRLYAMRICRTCPVQRECAKAGEGEPVGIWGGVDKAHPTEPPTVDSIGRRLDTKARRALITAIEVVAGKDGSFAEASEATGKTTQALRRALRRANRPDLVERLEENKPVPPSKVKPSVPSLRERRTAEFIATVSLMARRGESMDDVCAHFAKSSNTIRQRLTKHDRRDLIDTLLTNRKRFTPPTTKAATT